MTRVILHLGDHKTGTSSLQRFLASGDCPDDIHYPETGRANGAGHHNLAWAIGADPRHDPQKGRWRDVWEEISLRAAPVAVISSEAFEFKAPARTLEAVRQTMPSNIIALDAILYLRPHPGRLMSSFTERVKRGIGPFDRAEFLNFALTGNRFRYWPRLRAWQEEVGVSALTLRVFSRSRLIGGDIISDFFQAALGREVPASQMPAANAGPCQNALRFMQAAGRAHVHQGGDRLARREAPRIRAEASRIPRGPSPRWTAGEARLIQSALGNDAAALDNLIGCRDFSQALSDAGNSRADPLEITGRGLAATA